MYSTFTAAGSDLQVFMLAAPSMASFNAVSTAGIGMRLEHTQK